ncbi:unnamed protein product [Microthlaspi erraticum]|uniref:Reverse transcriptase domain-containing protein n=1 Tax=Microthlaspi erraticum TaxID=1685480 RepID=A0A6D2IX23_9BRAS|nr:unnamed protein product [Microthlaspi erraticum]CAA7033145.1 unnamed protein product [Microthlaspi erraticum]
MLCNIGHELGEYKEQILTKMTAKIKVEVNGLQPLSKDAVIEFEGGQEAIVTFEYENLGKHCSLCFSLSHEEDLCPVKPQTLDLRDPPTRQTERGRFSPIKANPTNHQRPFNLRQDRHGRPFGERPSYKRAENGFDQLRTRGKGQPLYHQRPRLSPPHPTLQRDPPTVHQYAHGSTHTEPNRGGQGETRRTNPLRTPPRQIWREKPPTLLDQPEDISTTNQLGPLVGRNLEIEEFIPLQRVRSEDEIMSSLQDVTVQYTNVDDPIERAARIQRVLESEAQGLMVNTARAMFEAQSPQPWNVTTGDRLGTIPQEGAETATADTRPIHLQTQTKRPRGRPPSKKTTQPTDANEAGTSKRKTKQARISPFLRISPLSRIIHTRTSPVTHGHGTRRSRVTLHQSSHAPSTSTVIPPSPTMVPAILHRLKELVKNHVPDVIFLIETNNKDEENNRLIPLTDYASRLFVPPTDTGGGGLALYWKQEIPILILSSCKTYIDTSLNYKGNLFFATFIYGEPDFSLRHLVWEELTNLGISRDKPWFLTGDFNEIIDNNEKSGGKQRTEASFGNFRDFLSQSDLFDLQHSGNFLSWRGTRHTHLVHCRLDRAMVNSMWLHIYPTSRCRYLNFEGSDHRPILSELQPEKKKKKSIFRYDRAMRHNPTISKLVKDTWNKFEDDTVERRIANCRKAISRWNRENHINSPKIIEEEKAKLDDALSAPIADSAKIQESTEKLDAVYKKEEEYWKQRSRSLWLALGDKNSGYFHAVTRGRKAVNKFSVLEEREGQPVYEEEDFVRVISAYFQNIFITRSPQCSETVSQAIKPCITKETNERLIAIPSNEEIRAALFAIHPDKAPGPDGFSASCFQTNWSVVCNRVTTEIRDFFITGHLPNSINETYVRLIPKVQCPKQVAEYRPIALCNVFYKIISKLLTKRLQPILSAIVSENQTVFVPGRAILDNVLITHETLHYLKGSKATKYCSMAVKTDMSKAYDRLEWNFIVEVLERMGFHAKWINWIFQCISTVSYSFLINGSAKGSVLPQRGIRQGDPLSPFIFILCSEVLTGLCNNAQFSGLLPGIKVARDSPRINHLLFADDTMFFCQTKHQCCTTLASILQKYEEASGQQINNQKSSISFSSKTPQDIKDRVKQALGIENEGGQGKYLGLPESFGRKKKDLFPLIVDCIRERAVNYSSQRLSAAGKLTLIKSVLSAIPTYSMSCFKIPVSLCKRIQFALTRFWWDQTPGVQKMSWTSWTKMKKSKSSGARVLQGKYCKDYSFLDVPTSTSSSHGWRGVLIGRDLLVEQLEKAIGNGQTTLWNDSWLSHTSPIRPLGPPNLQNKMQL